MTIEWIMTGGFLGITGLVLNMMRMNNGHQKSVWRRIDEHKVHNDDKYQHQMVAKILYEQNNRDHSEMKADIREIKGDVKLLLKRNGIGK